MISVVIVEDNETIREGLALLINATAGMQCIQRFSSCEALFKQMNSITADVVLMDIGLPGISGIEGIKQLREKSPQTLVLMLTIYEDDEHIIKALCAGACGYLVKKTPPAQLISAICEAVEGGSPMNTHIARKVVKLFQQHIRKSDDKVLLSDREREILRGLSDGNSYKMLADKLFISVDTIRYHIRNIYQKLHVHSQSQAVATALRKGLI